eukprot:602373-Prymnesium_polylepis.1
MEGSDSRIKQRARWSLSKLDFKNSRVAWLSLPQSGGVIITNRASAWDQLVQVDVNTSGLLEQSKAYIADVQLNVTSPADVRLNQIFVVSVLLYVSSEVVASHSGWMSTDAYQMCPSPGSRTIEQLHVTLGVTSEIMFQGCDTDSLPVDHKLPRDLESGGDRRNFTAVLTRVEPHPGSVSLQIEYSGNGAYKVLLETETLRTFALTLHLGSGGQNEQFDVTRRVDAHCPANQRPLLADSVYCGVDAGYTLNPNGGVSPCRPGFAKATVGNEPCKKCDEGMHAPAAGASTCQSCLPGFIPSADAVSCDLCKLPTFARPGSPECSICAPEYFQENTSLPASSTNCKRCDQGLLCSNGTTLATIVLESGFWRHSSAAGQVSRCEKSGDWSPCRGGSNASRD